MDIDREVFMFEMSARVKSKESVISANKNSKTITRIIVLLNGPI